MVSRVVGQGFLGASSVVGVERVRIISAEQFAGEIASRPGARFTIQGTGHSAGPVAHSKTGPILESVSASGELRIEGEQVTVDSRLSWMVVEQALNARGRSFAVLPDYLHLTVGGTLSVGGIGFGSIEFGAQIHNVLSLRLVTAHGEILHADPAKNSELFHGVLAGLGEYGWIRDVTLKTIARRPRLVGRIYARANLEAFANMIRFLESFGAGGDLGLLVGAYISRDGYFVEVAMPDNSERAAPFLAALRAFAGEPFRERKSGAYAGVVHREREGWLQKHQGCRHYWSDFVLDFDGMQALLGHELELSGRIRARQLAMLNVLPIRRPETLKEFALQPFSSIGPGYDYAVGVYFVVPDGDEAGKVAATESLRRLGDRCAELGGRPYLYGLHPSEKLWAQLRQSVSYRAAARLKLKMDPQNRLGSGLFLG